MQILERRWQALFKQILQCERELDQSALTTKFDEEFQALNKVKAEYQLWIEKSLATSSTTEAQVMLSEK